MIQAVLFDLGGTLHTSDSPAGWDVRYAARLLERLADYGIRLELSPDALALLLKTNCEAYKHHTEQILRELPAAEIWSDYYLRGLGVSRETLEPIAEELSFRYDYDRTRVLRRPHLKQTIDALRDMGIRMGLISNIISTSVAPHFLAEYGIEDAMECVVLSSVTGIRKPDPAIFQMAAGACGVPCGEMAYVGDTLSRDVLGCRNAGVALSIQIQNPDMAFRDAAFVNTGLAPDVRISDLAEIPDIVRAYNARASAL